MIKRIFQILTVVLVVLVIAFLVYEREFATEPQPAPEPESFDTDPQTVILYYDIHYPGIPKPTVKPGDRYCTFIPQLRIWGDNLALYNEDTLHLINPQIGYLNPATRSAIYSLMVKNGFLPTGPTQEVLTFPSGMMTQYGVKLLSRKVIEYPKGLSAAIFDLVKAQLSVFSSYSQVDPRITELIKQYENCNAYF